MTTAAPQKKKYTPQILNTFKYRGFLIREVFNRKTKRVEFKSRFQINNREFNLTNDLKKDLEEMIDEIYYQERRAKADLPTPAASPTLKELFDRCLPTIARHHQKVMAKRVFDSFLELLPEGIRIRELRRAHFQKYIDFRLVQTAQQSKRLVTPQTVNRERSILSAAWRAAPTIFPELDDFEPFRIPKAKTKRTRRENIVSITDFEKLIAHLTRPKKTIETDLQYFHRVRLAHTLEFALETGFRRKEIAALTFSQFDAPEHCLRFVKRFKTGTVTPFFPLSENAERIVRDRRELQGESEFIFSPDGKPIEANYRTLKKVCKDLGISYGRFAGGFVAHDLRRNFATRVIEHADIKTVAQLLGHSTTQDTQVYLNTNDTRLRNAIKKDYSSEAKRLKDIFELVEKHQLKYEDFVREIGDWCYNNNGSK